MSDGPTFRAVARVAAARGESNLKLLSSEGAGKLLDIDLQALTRQLASLDDAGQAKLLVQAMAP
ncbi:MAG: hypothetical protein H7238_04645, partial [Polaromonas sp.]|nr:hypothetical protein [Polaromonas sp.]